MVNTGDVAHGAAGGEGAESCGFVHGVDIGKDMSHADLMKICQSDEVKDMQVQMCCKVDKPMQYAFIEFKPRELASKVIEKLQSQQNHEKLQSANWNAIGEGDWISILSSRRSYKHEVRVVGLSNESPKELEKACNESVGDKEVEEVVLYGNYALVYFNTEKSASAIRKNGLTTKRSKIWASDSKSMLRINNLEDNHTIGYLKRIAEKDGSENKAYNVREDEYSCEKYGLIIYNNEAYALYGKMRWREFDTKLMSDKVFYASTEQGNQDLISYTIGDETSYIDFIKKLRNKLVDFDSRRVVEDIFPDDNKRGAHRVLDKFPQRQAAQWIRIKLRAGKYSTVLAVRKHNVYIKGFTGKEDKRTRWFELPEGNNEKSQMKLPGKYKAKMLVDGWSVSYGGVMKLNDLEQVKKTLSNTRLGKAFAERAVRRLSSYPDDVANNDDIPVRLALAGLMVMICEAARMNPCLDAIAHGWTRGTGLTTRMKNIIWDWSNMSAALLKWKEDGYRKWPHQRTDSPAHALSSVYLVLNTSARIEGTNQAWVEILSVKAANFHPDGMTVKVFDGENEGHIIYQKEKQQGEQDAVAASSSRPQQIGGQQHEMVPLDLKSGKCSSGNEWFGISVGDGDGSSSTEFKCDCRKQDGLVTEHVTRNINFDSERSIEVTYLVMSDAVKATVKVHLLPKVDLDYNNKLTEKEGNRTKQAKKYTVRGKISARIGGYEGQIMLLSPGEKCEIVQNELALSLPRHDVMMPRGRKLHIDMDLNITDDSEAQVVQISDVKFTFAISSPPRTIGGIKVDVTWPTETKVTEMKPDFVWTIGDGNKFTELIEQLRVKCAKHDFRGERKLLIEKREEAPPQWIHIKLELKGEETSSITLAIRDDILFGAGFMNQAGVWYSLISPDTEMKLLGEQYNSVSLIRWGRTYPELVGPSDKQKKAIEKLGKSFVTTAVRTLSRYPDVDDRDSDQPSDQPPSVLLAGLSVVFCESAIWEPLKEHLKYVWEMKEDDPRRKSIKEPLEEYIQKWYSISCALNTDGAKGLGELLASINIDSEQDALKHIRLVYNGPPHP